mmetsp:Transcript_4748/g.9634  ORF Transcript_4748/g.9634 Transcript_4748/m.9634 type:complete len:188 (+) Transcript_4748:18-581(+)
MNLSIQFPELTVQVEACETDLVTDLKKKMSFFSEDKELLAFNGRILQDDAPLHSFGIHSGSTIYVISKAGCIINKKKSAITAALQAIGSGCFAIFSCLGSYLPTIVLTSGMIMSSLIISSGMTLAARHREATFMKEEIKETVKEIMDGALKDLSVPSYSGATALFKEIFGTIRVGATRLLYLATRHE